MICLKDKDEIKERTERIKKLLEPCNIKSCTLWDDGNCNFKISISIINILNCPKNYNKL